MLPLLSITRPMVRGISSCEKSATFCSTLSSNTRKLAPASLSIMTPWSSITETCRTTICTLDFRTLPPPWFCAFGSGGGAMLILGVGGSGGCDWESWACDAVACELGAWARRPDSAPVRKIATKKTKDRRSREKSAARGVIAVFRIDTERRQPLWRTKRDFDFAPFAIMFVIAWPVTHHVLVSQFHADLGSNVRQFAGRSHVERPAAGGVRQIVQQRRAVALFGRWTTVGFVKADGVDLHVRFLHEAADVVLAVPAVIIASVGDDEQRFLSIVCPTHLAETEIHAVVKRRKTVRGRIHQAALNIVNARR